MPPEVNRNAALVREAAGDCVPTSCVKSGGVRKDKRGLAPGPLPES